ncbi:hypothetical protein OHB26_18645 [Nocardia sp. NBC_01503]|nr:hypothetical protein [Nocardia sp. NBC_01503]WTL36032.1 hypothetical protein OHB26_18645 [Nocardia sp. NBC_01503]
MTLGRRNSGSDEALGEEAGALLHGRTDVLLLVVEVAMTRTLDQ